jgi:hypothetical protein
VQYFSHSLRRWVKIRKSGRARIRSMGNMCRGENGSLPFSLMATRALFSHQACKIYCHRQANRRNEVGGEGEPLILLSRPGKSIFPGQLLEGIKAYHSINTRASSLFTCNYSPVMSEYIMDNLLEERFRSFICRRTSSSTWEA